MLSSLISSRNCLKCHFFAASLNLDEVGISTKVGKLKQVSGYQGELMDTNTNTWGMANWYFLCNLIDVGLSQNPVTYW